MSKSRANHSLTKFISKLALFAAGSLIGKQVATATDLTIRLATPTPISRKVVRYRCDTRAVRMGLPVGAFPVEYINGGGNSLVVVPVAGKSLIFANIVAGSGARYVAGPFTWWEAGGAVSFSSDSLAGKAQATCKPTMRP